MDAFSSDTDVFSVLFSSDAESALAAMSDSKARRLKAGNWGGVRGEEDKREKLGKKKRVSGSAVVIRKGRGSETANEMRGRGGAYRAYRAYTYEHTSIRAYEHTRTHAKWCGMEPREEGKGRGNNLQQVSSGKQWCRKDIRIRSLTSDRPCRHFCIEFLQSGDQRLRIFIICKCGLDFILRFLNQCCIRIHVVELKVGSLEHHHATFGGFDGRDCSLRTNREKYEQHCGIVPSFKLLEVLEPRTSSTKVF